MPDKKKIIHEMVHDLKRMAIPFNEINELIKTSEKDCLARPAYRKLVKIFNKVMEEGCEVLSDSDGVDIKSL